MPTFYKHHAYLAETNHTNAVLLSPVRQIDMLHASRNNIADGMIDRGCQLSDFPSWVKRRYRPGHTINKSTVYLSCMIGLLAGNLVRTLAECFSYDEKLTKSFSGLIRVRRRCQSNRTLGS